MGSEISPTNDLTLSLFHCVKLTKRRCLILLLGVSNQTLLMPKSKDSRYLLRVWKHALKNSFKVLCLINNLKQNRKYRYGELLLLKTKR